MGSLGHQVPARSNTFGARSANVAFTGFGGEEPDDDVALEDLTIAGADTTGVRAAEGVRLSRIRW